MRKLYSPIAIIAGLIFFCGSIKAQTNLGKLIFHDEIFRLQLINSDGTGQTILTSGQTIRDGRPAFSPDGSKIAFDRGISGKTNIFVMNADGTNPVAITTNSPLPDAMFNISPTWSPDGTKVAFISDRGGFGRSEIWVINVDGTGLVKLTTNIQHTIGAGVTVLSSDRSPSWSPDGSRIAFSSNRDSASQHELYVMNADGSNQIRLTIDSSDDDSPSWSPDSQKIVFTKNGGIGKGINIMNADGTNVVHITNDGVMPAWSPDGLRIAFLRFDSNHFLSKLAIFIMNVDGTNQTKITNNSFDCWDPAWAPSSSGPVPTSTISGLVRDGNGTPVDGATLTLSNSTQLFNRTTQSDATGAYSFSGLPAGNYKVSVAKSGFGFDPPSVDITNLTSNVTANFTAWVAFSISGQVSGLSGNLFIALTGSTIRTVLTDNNGNYSFDLLRAGGDYTITFHTPFWNFSPTKTVTFTNLQANQVANFEATRAFYTISGRITRLGVPKAGITVDLPDSGGSSIFPTTVTDADGRFTFTNVMSGRTYFLRPGGANYRMQPQSYTFDPLDGNKTADFVALSANNILFLGSSFNLIEANGTLVLAVVRGGNASGVGPITVDYTTVNGTATAGADYTAVSGTLNFPEGTTQQTISIPILNDQLSEGTEQFTVRLSNPTGEVDLVAPSTFTVTITDNEPAPGLKLATATNSDRAIALNAASFMAEVFGLTTVPTFGLDNRTRLLFFVENLPSNTPVIVEADDSLQNHFQLAVESISELPGSNPFSQVMVRLPDNLTPGDVIVKISAGDLFSNKVRITVQP